MNREIKFRGKRLDNGEWVYGYFFITPLTNETGIADSFLSGTETKYQICDKDGVVFEVDPETVGQFTGLKDKNGKEIYKGDIIECGGEKYRVGFNDYNIISAFEVTYGTECYWSQFCCNPTHNKVIGNIYDNKDILTKKSK